MSVDPQWFEQDYYRVLGVDRRATAAEIAAAYRRLAKRYHPDATHTDLDGAARFRQITEAKDVLLDPQRRAEHDRIRELIDQPRTWKEEEPFYRAERARAAPRRRGSLVVVGLIALIALVVGGMLLLAQSASQVGRLLPTVTVPSDFIPTHEDRIDRFTESGDCVALDRELSAAQAIDERIRARTGKGYPLLRYIERARTAAGCS
jgi:hypothetical protein